MELQVINDKGKPTAKVAASDAAFGREYNEALVHQVVTAYLANARQGTRAQKPRGEINKSNKKPWRQKGTGRARAGRASSPLWRGGGKIFPNLPECRTLCPGLPPDAPVEEVLSSPAVVQRVRYPSRT